MSEKQVSLAVAYASANGAFEAHNFCATLALNGALRNLASGTPSSVEVQFAIDYIKEALKHLSEEHPVEKYLNATKGE